MFSKHLTRGGQPAAHKRNFCGKSWILTHRFFDISSVFQNFCQKFDQKVIFFRNFPKWGPNRPFRIGYPCFRYWSDVQTLDFQPNPILSQYFLFMLIYTNKPNNAQTRFQHGRQMASKIRVNCSQSTKNWLYTNLHIYHGFATKNNFAPCIP